MNILFLYDSPLIIEKGGTERTTFLVMEELKKRGHQCYGLLHFNQKNPKECFLNSSPIKSLTDYLRDYHIDIVVNQIAFHYWLLKAFLDNGGKSWVASGGKVISFMHFDPSPGSKPFPYREQFKGFRKKSLWGKLRRLSLLFYIPFLRRKVNKTRQFSFRYVYDNSDAYVLLSKSYISPFMLQANLHEGQKIHVIPNMLSFPDILDEELLLAKEKIVLVVARMDEKQKRISMILRIWNKVRDHRGFQLHIVGGGQNLNDYKELVSKIGIQDVVFCGQQSPLPFYIKSEIFLMTSLREGFGLTITESMQNGVVPIVLNTSSVFSDIITDGIDGYLPENENLFQQRLELLLENDSLRHNMAIKALINVQKFSHFNVGNSWSLLLNKIIKN